MAVEAGPLKPTPLDVFVHPAHGTYNRIPLSPKGDAGFSYKIVEAVSDSGKPFRLVFIDPKTRSDDPSKP